MRSGRAKLAIAGALGVAILAGAAYRWYYPYGYSHCCDKMLAHGLLSYAHTHGGAFPAGGATPEASLSLLYPEYMDAELLRGKTVPVELVRERLERGEHLNPETCGWHYVEGLTLADDDRLALFWDKAGLGHNGQRLSEGGHFVGLVSGHTEYVPDREWAQFLQEQNVLLAARDVAAKKAIPVLSAKIRLPSGEIVESYDAPFTLIHFDSSESGSGRGSSGGPKLVPQVLRWWKLSEFGLGGAKQGTLTLTLSLDGRRSKPVTLTLSDGRLSSNSILFEMPTEAAQRPSP